MTGLDNGYQQKMLAQLAALARATAAACWSARTTRSVRFRFASCVAVLERGRIAVDGPPIEIVTAETIEDARGVRRLLPPTRAAS